MKIIWCHSHFLHWMGSSKYIFEVTKILSKRNEVVVAASVFSPEALKNFRSIGIKTYSLNNMSTNSVSYWLNLKNNIIKESEKLKSIANNDDTIITSMFPMNCVAERLENFHIQCCWEPYALFHDKNYVKGFRLVEKIFISLITKLYKNLDIQASKTSDRIITLSEYNKKWIRKVYGRNDVDVSYEGVDTKFFKGKRNSLLENKYKYKNVIFHSTDFTETKGTRYLIKAMPNILKSFPESILLVTSTIQDPKKIKDYLDYAKKHGFIKNIEFLGKVNYKLLPAYYSLASVSVQPSIGQNMSLPVKEAMSCEVPVLVTKDGNEQVPSGKAGILIDSKNPDSIADGVIRILNDKRLATRMGKYGRKFVLEKFTWDKVASVFDKNIGAGSKNGSVENKKPLFSIITCTLNSQKYLSRNIRSIKHQTFKKYEHIFIDSHSTDNTLSLIKKYKNGDPIRVKVISIDKKGISVAMNEGIKNARGTYIIHLHSDDSLHDTKVLDEVCNFLQKQNFPDWIYGKIQVTENTGRCVGVFPRQRFLQVSNPHLLKFINFIPHQSVFIQKRVFKKFGYFDTRLVSSMDYDYWLRISQKTQWAFFDRTISNYTIHSESQSSAKTKAPMNNFYELKVVKKHLSTYEYIIHRLVKMPIDFYNRTLR